MLGVQIICNPSTLRLSIHSQIDIYVEFRFKNITNIQVLIFIEHSLVNVGTHYLISSINIFQFSSHHCILKIYLGEKLVYSLLQFYNSNNWK